MALLALQRRCDCDGSSGFMAALAVVPTAWQRSTGAGLVAFLVGAL